MSGIQDHYELARPRPVAVLRSRSQHAFRSSSANEKLNAISSFMNNAGLALLVASVARWFDPGRDLEGATVAALCVGALAIVSSVATCGFLSEIECQ